MFVFTEDHIRQLCALNNFPVPEEGMVFFGLRGATLVNPDNFDFQKEHKLVLSEIDYVHPRCTVGQWLPKDETIAVFPASTVPHKRHVKTAMTNSGRGR